MTSRLLPFLSLIAAVGIFFAYINPLWNGNIAQAKSTIAADDQALASAAEYVKRENELATEANKKIDQPSLDRLAVFLPDSVDNVGLILDMNALAAKSGLALSSIDAADTSTAAASADATVDPIGTIDLTLAAKGTYDALHTFLDGVEHSERLLDVRDLAVTGSDTGVYTYQMTIRIYWLR